MSKQLMTTLDRTLVNRGHLKSMLDKNGPPHVWRPQRGIQASCKAGSMVMRFHSMKPKLLRSTSPTSRQMPPTCMSDRPLLSFDMVRGMGIIGVVLYLFGLPTSTPWGRTVAFYPSKSSAFHSPHEMSGSCSSEVAVLWILRCGEVVMQCAFDMQHAPQSRGSASAAPATKTIAYRHRRCRTPSTHCELPMCLMPFRSDVLSTRSEIS